MSFIINPYMVAAAGGGLPVTTGLWGHWDAAEGITKDGSNDISKWEDQSGNGHDWEQSVTLYKPTFVASEADLNGLPVVNFAGVYLTPESMYLTGPDDTFYESGDSGAYTIFAAYTDINTGQSNLGGMLSGQYNRSPSTDPAIATIMIFKAGSNGHWRGWQTMGPSPPYTNIGYTGGNTFNDADAHVIGETFHGSQDAGTPSSFGATIDIDGSGSSETNYPTLAQANTTFNTVAEPDFLFLNKQWGYIVTPPTYIGCGLAYKLAEMILYKGALTNADFNTMATYLNTKYAVYP